MSKDVNASPLSVFRGVAVIYTVTDDAFAGLMELCSTPSGMDEFVSADAKGIADTLRALTSTDRESGSYELAYKIMCSPRCVWKLAFNGHVQTVIDILGSGVFTREQKINILSKPNAIEALEANGFLDASKMQATLKQAAKASPS